MESPSSLVDRLKNVRHFRNLSPADLLRIVNAGRLRTFECGQTIYNEGEPCSGMFVLLRGRVHLCKLGPLGQINIISVVEPVIMINEVAVLDGGPNPVTAFAAENCLMWNIGHQSFQELVQKIPQVGLSLLQVLAKRNRQMINHYEDLSFRSVIARTAKLLLDLSSGGCKPIDRRKCSIEEMAHRVATVPEAISRSLNALKSVGAIQVSRSEISVLSARLLAEQAQVEQELK